MEVEIFWVLYLLSVSDGQLWRRPAHGAAVPRHCAGRDHRGHQNQPAPPGRAGAGAVSPASRRHSEQGHRARLRGAVGLDQHDWTERFLKAYMRLRPDDRRRPQLDWPSPPTSAKPASCATTPSRSACAGLGASCCCWWWPRRLPHRALLTAFAPAGGPPCCPCDKPDAAAHSFFVHSPRILHRVRLLVQSLIQDSWCSSILASAASAVHLHHAPLSARYTPFAASLCPQPARRNYHR